MSREESGWSSPGIRSIRWGILVAYLMNWRIHLIVQERTLLCVLLLKLWVIERLNTAVTRGGMITAGGESGWRAAMAR